MSIKTKIRSLIAAANAKTGKGDTDLTTAVQSLISESGGITPSGNKAITATTSTQTGIDVTNYATVSVAPTPSEAIVVTTNGDATPSSGKLLSKVTVNVPTGEARDSSDLTVSGATVNVPAGLYSSAASKSVASGTAGTPTASKGAVSNNSVTVTPSVANTTGYITGGTKTGTGVTVSASELVSGNKAITPSETAQSGIDVANFKTVSVDAISSTYVGSGVTKKAAATVAPSTSEQTVCASGVYTTGEQKVSAITPSIVGNLDASSFAASIVSAIEGKGVDVPSGAKLDALAALIESIEAGGGANIATGSFTINTSNEYSTTITHGLGAIPKIVLVLWDDASLNSIKNNYYYIAGFAYQDGEFNDSVKMMSVNIVYQASRASWYYCSKINDIVYYNGFDIRSSSPYKYCSIYNVNENTFSVDTRLNTMTTTTNRHYFAAGGTYKWIAI